MKIKFINIYKKECFDLHRLSSLVVEKIDVEVFSSYVN